MYKKIEGQPGYVKDMNTGAILSIDKKAAAEYERQRQMIQKAKTMEDRLSNLENTLEEIKELLKK